MILFRGDEAMYERSIKTINSFHIFPGSRILDQQGAGGKTGLGQRVKLLSILFTWLRDGLFRYNVKTFSVAPYFPTHISLKHCISPGSHFRS